MSAQAIDIDRHSIEALDQAIRQLSARMDAACYEQLVLIREFDERAGWLQWMFGNCSEWLAWRCDISLSAAREKVRVAHALLPLPNLSQAFAEGRLSYTKVRALTRVAQWREEGELLRFALKHTATQVEERCREWQCGTSASTDLANRVHARRYLSLHRNVARGTVSISLEVPLEEGELIAQALDVAREKELGEDADRAGESWSAQQADALVAMARAYLEGREEPRTGSKPLITVHVDRSALTDGRGRSALPIQSVRRLACDAKLASLLEDEEQQPLSVGRQTRTVPNRLLKALWARDKGCRFPGCHRRRFVDAHHVQHWADGGETCADNLLLLCTRHHRAVHEGGFSIAKDFQDQWRFFRPDGIAVPACGYVVDEPEHPKPGLSLAKVVRSLNKPSARGFMPGGKEPSLVVSDSPGPGG